MGEAKDKDKEYREKFDILIFGKQNVFDSWESYFGSKEKYFLTFTKHPMENGKKHLKGIVFLPKIHSLNNMNLDNV